MLSKHTSTNRYLCIHGHFYQPPRENPWLDQIEIQESAHPFHDWNEKIAYECYTPNSCARLLDPEGRLRDLVNTYEHISFDFGPTLLSWLDKHARETYQSVLEADALSCERRSGHGNALAQAYNHMIMPLASERDRRTQVLWGIKDFRTRFCREPEGMWLPETAVDSKTLEILAENGILFTILAPGQAARFRGSSRDAWATPNPSSIDPSRPYLCRLSRGLSIVLFFYDAPISHSIAFESLLNDGENFKDRLLGAFSTARTWPQLVHIATDGESYGHHHRFGEMALAYALERLTLDPSVNLTNYGEFLEKHPPTAEAEYIESSSWSCIHGVGRWSEDCSCSVSQRPDWNQRWRKPLRNAMDLLRDRVDKLFETQGGALLQDPWKARDEYLEVLPDEHQQSAPFLDAHAVPELLRSEREMILHLLEMQRNRMLMYTSCGWFFDDIIGIESLQILRYAARALQLAYPFDPELLNDFLAQLAEAKSNVRPQLRGDEIFRQKIVPQIAGLPRVAAHVAISAIFGHFPSSGRIYCYDVTFQESCLEESGERTLLVGTISVQSRIMIERKDFFFAVVHLGGVDLRCSVKELPANDRLVAIQHDLLDTFRTQSSTELVRKLDRFFPARYFSLKDLFADQRRKIIDSLTEKMFQHEARQLESFYRKNRDLAKIIVETEGVLPDTFLAASRFVLNRSFAEELAKLANGTFPDKLETVLEEARFWNIAPDVGAAEQLIRSRIVALLGTLGSTKHDRIVAEEIIRFLDLATDIEIPVPWGSAQVAFFRIVKSLTPTDGGALPPLYPEIGLRLGVRLDSL